MGQVPVFRSRFTAVQPFRSVRARLDHATSVAGTPNLRSASWMATRIALSFGVTVADLKGPLRERKYTIPRWFLMKELRDELGWSTTRIGRFLNRDHTTVIHGLRRIETVIAEAAKARAERKP